MTLWVKRLCGVMLTGSIILSSILAGATWFISETKQVKGEVVHKSVADRGIQERMMRFPPNTKSIYNKSVSMDGVKLAYSDRPISNTLAIHIPIGKGGKEYFDQNYLDRPYYVFVYSGELAKTDTDERYLLDIQDKLGGYVELSVSKEQYGRVDVGDYVTIRGDTIRVFK